MIKLTTCPYCGKEPVETITGLGFHAVACPDGHRRSHKENWNLTNENYIKQFNKVIRISTQLTNN